jgi:beta-glucosidase-like glycosyl hydrolase
MMMFSSRKLHDEYIEGYKQALKNTTILMDRLNDQVARIISVKIALGIAKLKPKSLIRDRHHHA